MVVMNVNLTYYGDHFPYLQILSHYVVQLKLIERCVLLYLSKNKCEREDWGSKRDVGSGVPGAP